MGKKRLQKTKYPDIFRLVDMTKEELRAARFKEIKAIMDMVRAHVAIHPYAMLGAVIALVDFSMPGQLTVHVYRQVEAGMAGDRYAANTKDMLADKKLWALPLVNNKGTYRLRHKTAKGAGLHYYTTQLLKSYTFAGPKLKYL